MLWYDAYSKNGQFLIFPSLAVEQEWSKNLGMPS